MNNPYFFSSPSIRLRRGILDESLRESPPIGTRLLPMVAASSVQDSHSVYEA